MTITIIANPHAGSGEGLNQLNELQTSLRQQQIHHITYQTTKPGELATIMRRMIPSLAKNEKLIIVGGDGTLNEAIDTLMKLQIFHPIAYLPAGTGNDFARQMNLTKNVDEFVTQLQEAKPYDLEFIQYEETLSGRQGIALNSLGFGLDAEICSLNTADAKKSKSLLGLSKLSYLTPIVHAFKNHQAFEASVKLTHQPVHEYNKLLLIGFFNHAYFGGGVKFVPQATQNSHSYEFVVARDVSAFTILKAAPFIIAGSHFEHFPNHLIRQTVTKASIQIKQPVLMQTDGEFFELPHAHIETTLAHYPILLTQK